VGQAYQISKIAGLRLSVEPLFFVGTLILWVVLSSVAILILELPVLQAVGGGLLAAFLYWFSEIIHQLGHAYAARQTGYPMIGIHLGKYVFFGSSLYPHNEESLPAKVHIRRALGGPIVSLGFTVVSGIFALLLYPQKDFLSWLVLYVCITNLLVFTIGPFLPLGFTDGSTLLRLWRNR
jgi:Zn-dependent protease